MSEPFIIHLLPVSHSSVHGWLLFSVGKIVQYTRNMPIGHDKEDCSWDRRLRSWWIAEDFLDAATVAIESASLPSSVMYCADCVHGDPCNRFDDDDLERAGYTVEFYNTSPEEPSEPQPSGFDWEAFYRDMEEKARKIFGGAVTGTDDVAAAAVVMGVRWPGATKEEVVKAFRKRASEAHPDHFGGSNEEMEKLLRARAALARALGGFQ